MSKGSGRMKVDLQEFRYIDIYVNEEKDIVIFPHSKAKEPLELADGSILDEPWFCTAYYPIELKYPYTKEELAEKIRYGIEQWDKHEPYNDFSGKHTFEEKYYGIKGFKKAIKGKRNINLGWDDIQGKYASLMIPCKSGYCYLGVDEVILDEDSDWIDYANVVVKFIETNIEDIPYARQNKRKLNL